jgi:hypothetical protein
LLLLLGLLALGLGLLTVLFGFSLAFFRKGALSLCFDALPL